MSEYASNGKANAGLALGIIGTALGAANWSGAGWGVNPLSRGAMVRDTDHHCQSFDGKISELESMIAQLTAEKYADQIGIDVYRAGVQNYKELDNKITANLEKLYGFVIDLDKKTALNTQALHYENVITNNKIDCCCDKANMQMAFNRQLSELADASILSYVNATFLPGTLKLPMTSICPRPITSTITTNTTN